PLSELTDAFCRIVSKASEDLEKERIEVRLFLKDGTIRFIAGNVNKFAIAPDDAELTVAVRFDLPRISLVAELYSLDKNYELSTGVLTTRPNIWLVRQLMSEISHQRSNPVFLRVFSNRLTKIMPSRY